MTLDRFPFTDAQLDGPRCPQCGAHGCDCVPDGDFRSYEQRGRDAELERRADTERDENYV